MTVKGQNNTLRMEQSSVVGFFQEKKLFVFFIHLYIGFKNTNPHAIQRQEIQLLERDTIIHEVLDNLAKLMQSAKYGIKIYLDQTLY